MRIEILAEQVGIWSTKQIAEHLNERGGDPRGMGTGAGCPSMEKR